jgi:urease accessory protein
MIRMFAAISPFDGPAFGAPLPEASGARALGEARVDLAFAFRDGATRVVGLYQKTPMRAFFPRHECGALAVAALANVGGGLVGGDRTEVRVRIDTGAAALVTSQAAEKVYRSTGADCHVSTRLEVAAGGWCEWCPQETILFDRSRLRRVLRLDLGAGARAMLGETMVLGRLASGERTSLGLLQDRIDVYRGPTLAWTDRLRLDGSYAGLLAAAAGLGGATALATFVYAAADAGDLIEPARDLLTDEGVRAGLTVVNGLLIGRFLAEDPLALRRAFALFWTRFRAAAAGLPPLLPRLWHV